MRVLWRRRLVPKSSMDFCQRLEYVLFRQLQDAVLLEGFIWGMNVDSRELLARMVGGYKNVYHAIIIKGVNIPVYIKGCIKLSLNLVYERRLLNWLAIMTVTKSMKGTPYWMAPEAILQTGHSLSIENQS
ncbi:mitogen-activated protein kinase kinase kinase NPK1-like [Solanum tuberosum]|uniref:mitogen-activated protein kinase kinase kinase NPK1-like n=1 Tax=Solanum tuberosum TaxID=4113 RepID=UPI00073A4D2E|nr:PREDICTED: mitogen-activated protein kinase kinase kinase NPK1-like [Solanum tuberosum]XP_015168515.1 PREDICTED: mitogen-activated protein kinase kinase kinase NPK1-like [Solanum tuberosum]XP_015168516.1 PREDICTED: mitogen-activated protein kinase kinase kinase NPK1-like [Solanum tuberosum]